jgi:hypothetical protein
MYSTGEGLGALTTQAAIDAYLLTAGPLAGVRGSDGRKYFAVSNAFWIESPDGSGTYRAASDPSWTDAQLAAAGVGSGYGQSASLATIKAAQTSGGTVAVARKFRAGTPSGTSDPRTREQNAVLQRWQNPDGSIGAQYVNTFIAPDGSTSRDQSWLTIPPARATEIANELAAPGKLNADGKTVSGGYAFALNEDGIPISVMGVAATQVQTVAQSAKTMAFPEAATGISHKTAIAMAERGVQTDGTPVTESYLDLMARWAAAEGIPFARPAAAVVAGSLVRDLAQPAVFTPVQKAVTTLVVPSASVDPLRPVVPAGFMAAPWETIHPTAPTILDGGGGGGGGPIMEPGGGTGPSTAGGAAPVVATGPSRGLQVAIGAALLYVVYRIVRR